jgi:hypothetical protein
MCAAACEYKKSYKLCIKIGLYGGNDGIIDIREIYEVSVSTYFVFEEKIVQPLTVAVGQVTSERNISLSLSLLFGGELDN